MITCLSYVSQSTPVEQRSPHQCLHVHVGKTKDLFFAMSCGNYNFMSSHDKKTSGEIV